MGGLAPPAFLPGESRLRCKEYSCLLSRLPGGERGGDQGLHDTDTHIGVMQVGGGTIFHDRPITTTSRPVQFTTVVVVVEP